MTIDGITAGHETLGRVEGMKSLIRQSKRVGAFENSEFSALMMQMAILETMIREIIAKKEKAHERRGGVFAVPVAPKMEISHRNVYKR